MVSVSIEADKVVFNIRGMHKVWALRSRIETLRSKITGVRHDPEAVRSRRDRKVFGTMFPGWHPGRLTAGTFRADGKRVFWDVVDRANALIIDLDHQDFDQLVIEVEDPERVVRLLSL